MSRVHVRAVEHLTRTDVRRLVPGYTSDEMYRVHPDPSLPLGYRLERVRRPRPFRKRYPMPPGEWERYRGFLRHGFSLGAYDGRRLVGLALVEARPEERGLWVWEFGVREEFRRQGIGTALLRELERRARAHGFRTIGLETQTTNVPAMDFYARNGYTVDRVDPGLYPRRLTARGEIAVLLGKRLRPRRVRHRRSTR